MRWSGGVEWRAVLAVEAVWGRKSDLLVLPLRLLLRFLAPGHFDCISISSVLSVLGGGLPPA